MLRLVARSVALPNFGSRITTTLTLRTKTDWVAPYDWDFVKHRNTEHHYHCPVPEKWEYYNEVVWPPNYSVDGKRKTREVFHVVKDLKYSDRHLRNICYCVRGMAIDDALRHLQFTPRKGAFFMRDALLAAQEKAVKVHNIEFKSNLWIAEAYSTKAMILKGLRRHARDPYSKRHPAPGYTTVRYRWSNLLIRLEEGPPPPYTTRFPPRTGYVQVDEYIEFLRSRKIEAGW